jgi:hypothetical protein
MVGGVGLLLAGDASHSQKEVEDAKQDVKTAIDSGDTTILNKQTEPLTKG